MAETIVHIELLLSYELRLNSFRSQIWQLHKNSLEACVLTGYRLKRGSFLLKIPFNTPHVYEIFTTVVCIDK